MFKTSLKNNFAHLTFSETQLHNMYVHVILRNMYKFILKLVELVIYVYAPHDCLLFKYCFCKGGCIRRCVVYIYVMYVPTYVYLPIINPRCACAERVTVVVSCVCVYVCVCVRLSANAIMAVRAIKSVTKDTVVLNVRFAAIL